MRQFNKYYKSIMYFEMFNVIFNEPANMYAQPLLETSGTVILHDNDESMSAISIIEFSDNYNVRP